MKKLFIAIIISACSLNTFALSNSIAAEDKGWESVILLAIPSFDTDGSQVTGYCNGTLIDAYTFISAAHCFQRSEIPAGKKMRVEIGEYRYIIKDGVKIKVGYRSIIRHESSVKVRTLPGVNLNSTGTIPPELDIVVVKLDAPVAVPPEFIYAPLWNQALPALNTSNKVSIVSINPMETISHNDTKQMAVLNRFTQARINIESTSTSRVAQGDSGAPVFATINAKTYLIGVVKGTVSTFGSTRDIFVTLQGRLNTQ